MSTSNERPPADPPPSARTMTAEPGYGKWQLQFGDFVFKGICQLAAWSVIVLALVLLAVMVWKAWESIQTNGLSFFSGMVWDPESTHRIFGARAFVFGTLATSAIAMLIAVPLGVGVAAFLAEIAPPWLRRIGSFLVEMLAAVPSVVYGFWGVFVLAPLVQEFFTAVGGPNQGGVGILTAGLILAIMIVPYVASVSFDVCRAVPQSQRAGAYALGATRWQMIWTVVLPYARPGIIGGCFLALGRALGETMAVTMLIGNKTDIQFSVFAMGNSIASVIANQFTEADYDVYLSALVELGLVLLLVSVFVNSLARLLIWRVNRPGRGIFGLGKLIKVTRKHSVGQENEQRLLMAQMVKPWQAVVARWTDRLMTVVLGSCLVLTASVLLLILGYITFRGVRALDWNFFTKLPAPVGRTGGGIANGLYGSAMLVGLATLFAVPIGLFAAIFLSEYRSERLGPAVRFVGELLSGVPSIVIGIFAYYIAVKPVGHFSAWAGSFALGIMMIPIVMRASEEALKLVPQSLRNASYALGAAQWQTVVRVVVPSALPAIITAVFLAIARVAGETAPLLLTAFGNQYWPRSPSDPTPSLPHLIFNYAISSYEEWHRIAWAGALVLLAVVMLLNFGVRIAAGKRLISASHAD